MFISALDTIGNYIFKIVVSRKTYLVTRNDDDVVCYTGPNFIELLSTPICLAWNFCLNKNRIIPTIFPHDFQYEHTTAEYQ